MTNTETLEMLPTFVGIHKGHASTHEGVRDKTNTWARLLIAKHTKGIRYYSRVYKLNKRQHSVKFSRFIAETVA